MCGIFGIKSKKFKKLSCNFFELLNHRGPDNRDSYIDEENNILLGHTRLSIIDLSTEAGQPMLDSSGRYILVFNGEIYNYKDLRKKLKLLGHNFETHSDTEVVLKSYIEWKEKCVNKFRGMFAFAIFDKNKEEFFLARDRFGIKPLIYTFLDDQFIFSSELKPLIMSDYIQTNLDKKSIIDYLKFGSVKQPKTIFKDVFHLMPGHYMKVDLEFNFIIEKYYNLHKESLKYEKISNYNQAVEQLREELEEATEYHMVSDVDVGAFLSGGIDSTAIVGLMNILADNKIQTFSVGFENKGNVTDETKFAKIAAEHFNTSHNEIILNEGYVEKIFDDFISSIDQPSIDGINTYIVSRETSKDIKVALSGLGGDEIFAGYPHFKDIRDYSNKDKSLTSVLANIINNIRPNRLTQKYQYINYEPEESVKAKRKINDNISNIANFEFGNYSHRTNSKVQDMSTIQRISKHEIDNYLLDTLLRDNDVLSMANSLEVRPILLDHKLVEFVFNLKDEFKIRNGQLKSIFIDSVKDIIPKETWQREKVGFEMPFSVWMNGVLNKKIKESLNAKIVKEIFTEDFLNKFKYRVNNSKLTRKDWLYFVFIKWISYYENYIGGIE
jgi:asparagine synthase (glutamine-hydrolysing)